jgi:hypothetical protein
MQLSASLRDSLIEQLAAINSADEAATWAHRNLPTKNRLAAADAKVVEDRFQARLLEIEQQETANESSRLSPGLGQTGSPSGQGPPKIRIAAGVPSVRPHAFRPASPHLHATARTGAQSER